MRRRTGLTRDAFTLVELLVVIGIIAVLIAILMPALNKARQQALTVKCASNLHNMGIAMTMYTQQYGAYPGHASLVAGTTAAIWPTRLRLFTNGDQGIWHCPAQEAGFEWPKTTGGTAGAADSRFGYNTGEVVLSVFAAVSSYGYNDWGTAPPTSDSREQRGLGGDIKPLAFAVNEVRVTQVKVASDMIAITDSTSDNQWDWNIDPLQADQWPGRVHGATKQKLPPLTPDPAGGSNVLYCDGHVEWHTQKELVTMYNSSGQATAMHAKWNNNNRPYPGP